MRRCCTRFAYARGVGMMRAGSSSGRRRILPRHKAPPQRAPRRSGDGSRLDRRGDYDDGAQRTPPRSTRFRPGDVVSCMTRRRPGWSRPEARGAGDLAPISDTITPTPRARGWGFLRPYLEEADPPSSRVTRPLRGLDAATRSSSRRRSTPSRPRTSSRREITAVLQPRASPPGPGSLTPLFERLTAASAASTASRTPRAQHSHPLTAPRRSGLALGTAQGSPGRPPRSPSRCSRCWTRTRPGGRTSGPSQTTSRQAEDLRPSIAPAARCPGRAGPHPPGAVADRGRRGERRDRQRAPASRQGRGAEELHEGFGLTVTEAMWKRRPVVASAAGGIQDQIRTAPTGCSSSRAISAPSASG